MPRTRPFRTVLPLAVAAAAMLPAFPPSRAATTPWTAVTIATASGAGALPVLATRPWNAAQPDVSRAVIVVHGQARDAAQYDVIGRQAQADAGAAGRDAMLVAPLFPAPNDATLPPAAGTVPPELGWSGTGWMEGAPADGPAPLTSFEVLDALVAHFSDRARYPNLREIVLVGHSGGGQLVQRYAELRASDPPPGAPNLRYVVANPSSYGWFTADRPVAGGGFAPFADAARCSNFDDWKYGMRNLPPAAGGLSPRQIEDRYVGRDVVYLLGALDNDPDLGALDHSCAAEAQGPTHLTRGQNFFRYLQGRHPGGLAQRLEIIPGAEHDPAAMLTAPCALAAIFDAPACGRTAPAAAPAPIPTPVPAPTGPLRHRPAQPPRRIEHHERLARGTMWQPGYWDWNGAGYVWVPGHVRATGGHRPVLVPGHWRWSWNGLGWVWVAARYR